jgi:hypothetical protein
MLNLLDLLSLMRLGAEDFIRDSERISATSAPSAAPSIRSRRPVPNGRQTSWHTEYRQRPIKKSMVATIAAKECRFFELPFPWNRETPSGTLPGA